MDLIFLIIVSTKVEVGVRLSPLGTNHDQLAQCSGSLSIGLKADWYFLLLFSWTFVLNCVILMVLTVTL